ncbi:Zinc finger protein 567 [Frankliniella fusca]|uniref:Zinc finger protein 567 n=1 Tax=Frankliniella fusca TaxID=407009 RepID=A0AAE1LSU2_9NEOP|nr:Zinc finger protein 567 [Frankliniella fusca]
MDEELVESIKEEIQNRDSLCRLCACHTQLLIPIFEGEGKENNLSDKITRHLPIQVVPNDVLPVQICFQCASTVISWDELSESCIEAEQKLKAMFITNDDLQCSPPGPRDANESTSLWEPFSSVDNLSPSNPEMVLSDNCSASEKNSEEVGDAVSKGGETERLIADVTEDIDDVLCVEIKKVYKSSETGCENQSQIDHCYTRGKENFNIEVGQQQGKKESLSQTNFRPIAPKPTLPPPLVNFVQSPHHLRPAKNFRELRNATTKLKEPQIYIVYNEFGTGASRKNALVQSSNVMPRKLSGSATNQTSTMPPLFTVTRTTAQPSFSRTKPLARPFPNLKEITVTRVPTNGVLKSPVKNIPKASVSVIRGGSYACKQCPAKFSNEMVFKRHMFVSHNVPKHCCPLCKASFGKKYELEVHIRQQHKKTLPKPKLPCKDCNETFETMMDLRVHVRDAHRSVTSRLEQAIESKRPILGVPITEKEAELLRKCHSRIENKDVFNCVVCQKTWPNLEKTVAHIRTHTKELLYACETCGQRFNTRGVMHRHMQVHSNSKPFSCDYCDKSFSSKQNRDDHHRQHTKEVKTVCESCGEFLTSASMLYYHRKIHSGVNPYKCPYCEKAYSIRSLLKRHIRYHTGEKPYLCSECGRAFKTPGQLRGHSAVHSDARPFACDGCGTMMKTKKYLNRHRAICSLLKTKAVNTN